MAGLLSGSLSSVVRGHPSGCDSERDAASTLGYTRKSWDNLSDEEKQPASTFKTWTALTDKERSALVVLGYTRARWDARSPDSASKYWGQLTDVQKEAAVTFGYNQKSWDNDSGEEKQPRSATVAWDKLKTKKKVALKVLGFTRASWDSRKPPSYYAYWKDLTDDERAAAATIGYNEKIWNNPSGNVKQPAFSKKIWANIPDQERTVLGVLGYTELNWDSKKGLPSALSKPWSELTVCGEDTCITPDRPGLMAAMLLPALNFRQVAKMKKMPRVHWDLIIGHGLHPERNSRLPLKKLGSRWQMKKRPHFTSWGTLQTAGILESRIRVISYGAI